MNDGYGFGSLEMLLFKSGLYRESSMINNK